MNKIKSLIAAAVLAGLGSSAFGAVVTATSAFSSVSDFTINFTDANYDGLMEYSEIDSFSGVTFTDIGIIENDFVYTTPDIAGISTFGSFNTVSTPTGPITFWDFRNTNSPNSPSTAGWLTWTYTIELDQIDPDPPSVVPLPASLPLMMGAIAVFGFMRRRKAIS